ncbi:AAA family ATPase [bacterium]|nr:AAA family ATPase [bacterium]
MIILTSNIGSDMLLEKTKEKKETTVDDMMPLLLNHFRPEFLNRIDDIILFNPLTEKEIK